MAQGDRPLPPDNVSWLIWKIRELEKRITALENKVGSN